MTMKASELKDFLSKIKRHKTSMNRYFLEDIENKLYAYLDDKFKPIIINENLIAGSESIVASGDNSSDDYNLTISASQERDIRQDMNDTIKLFGHDW